VRLVAFSLFATAAFDWPLPWLDRAGAAALGFAFLALALAPGGFPLTRRAQMNLPPKRGTLPDEDEDAIEDVLDRLRVYGMADRTS